MINSDRMVISTGATQSGEIFVLSYPTNLKDFASRRLPAYNKTFRHNLKTKKPMLKTSASPLYWINYSKYSFILSKKLLSFLPG